MDKKRLGNIIAISLVTVFMGQGYIAPFSQWFTFSLAVLVLSLLLIHFEELSIIEVSTSIGVLMFIFRAFINYMANPGIDFYENLLIYMPVIIYYIVFGTLFKVYKIREKLDEPLMFIMALWICDSAGNVAEAVISHYIRDFNFDKAVVAIILVGLIRSCVTYSIYRIVRYAEGIFEIEQKEKKFRELLLFTAKLKTELFFLKKSMVDIELMMEESYSLYEKIDQLECKNMALNISKNIHEIKKDYIRVVAGMENTLNSENTSLSMSVTDVFKIVEDATCKLIEFRDIDVKVNFITQDDFKMLDYYSLISVLNNLITNAIDAIDLQGEIIVQEYKEKDEYVFKVIDDGKGIDEEDIDLIFEPGFTNKYDVVTGKMSTGIGLYHVRNIVTNQFDGIIDVYDWENMKTVFEIRIPIKKIEGSV